MSGDPSPVGDLDALVRRANSAPGCAPPLDALVAWARAAEKALAAVTEEAAAERAQREWDVWVLGTYGRAADERGQQLRQWFRQQVEFTKQHAVWLQDATDRLDLATEEAARERALADLQGAFIKECVLGHYNHPSRARAVHAAWRAARESGRAAPAVPPEPPQPGKPSLCLLQHHRGVKCPNEQNGCPW